MRFFRSAECNRGNTRASDILMLWDVADYTRDLYE